MTSVIHLVWFWTFWNKLLVHNKNILSIFTKMKSINQSINQSWPLISSSSVLSSSHLNTLRVSLHHSGSTRSFLVSVIHLEAYLAVTSFHPPSVTLRYKITKYSDHQSTHENDWKLHCRQHLLNLTLNA